MGYDVSWCLRSAFVQHKGTQPAMILGQRICVHLRNVLLVTLSHTIAFHVVVFNGTTLPAWHDIIEGSRSLLNAKIKDADPRHPKFIRLGPKLSFKKL